MKYLCALVFLLMVKAACCQDVKLVDAKFFQNGREKENISYYIVKNDTATKLRYKQNKLTIPQGFLQKRKCNMIAVYNGNAIVFGVDTSEFYYIKISSYKAGPMKIMYSVNIGSEYDELVKPVARKIAFRKYVKVE